MNINANTEQLRQWIFKNYPSLKYDLFIDEYAAKIKAALIINDIFKYRFKKHSESVFQIEEIIYLDSDKLGTQLYSFKTVALKYSEDIHFSTRIIIPDLKTKEPVSIIDHYSNNVEYREIDFYIKKRSILCSEKQLNSKLLLWFLVVNKFWLKYLIKNK